MDVHELKTWPEYFAAIANGLKKFELRKNDRGFKVNDQVQLREYDPKVGYTGWQVHATISYILPGGQFGLADDTCVMSLFGISDPYMTNEFVLCKTCGMTHYPGQNTLCPK